MGDFRRHLSDLKGFTGRFADWELKFKEAFTSKEAAIKKSEADQKLEEQKND